MLEELTPEQQFELCHYASIEPFGEVRSDMRTALQAKQRYDIARGRRGRDMALGEFMLYRDIAEDTAKHKATESLVIALDSMAAKSKKLANREPRERIKYGQ